MATSSFAFLSARRAAECRVRSLKAALVGLVGGVLLTAAVVVAQVVYVDEVMAAQLAKCEAESKATAAGAIWFGYVQFREWMVPVAFGIGFTAAFFWILRPQR